MKKNAIIAAGATLVGVVIFAVTVGGGSRDDAQTPTSSGGQETVVTSSDGIATLTIPQGALPAGVSQSDISITSLPPETISDDVLERLVFALEPDGTVLGSPAMVSIAIDPPAEGEPFGIPLVLHLSGEEDVEVLDGVVIAFDEETGAGTLSFEVGHFSLISYERTKAMFDVAVSPRSGSFNVGETFNRTLTVTPRKGDYTNKILPWGKNREERATHMDVRYGIANGTRWKVGKKTFDMTTWDESVLSPMTLQLVEKDMAATEAYRHDYPFTCIGEGKGDVSDRGAFFISFTLQRETKWRHREKTDFKREARFVVVSVPWSFGEERGYDCTEATNPPPNLTVPDPEFSITVCGGITGIPCPGR